MVEPTRRELQARQTREDVIRAARASFAERGYAATTVRDIAARAGVVVQTVYDSVGRKRELALALQDALSSDAGTRQLVSDAFASRSVDELASVPARITASILRNAADIVRLANS